MIQQIKTSTKNVLAIEIIDGYTETDEKLFQKLFQEKLDAGNSHIHVLIKIDELKISHSSVKAFFEDTIWGVKNYKKLGHLAVVAHSKIIKAIVPIDNLFMKQNSEGRLEKYFDVSQMDEAMKFVGMDV